MENTKQYISIFCEKAKKVGFTPLIQIIYIITFILFFTISILFFVKMINSLQFMEKYNCKTNIKELFIFMSILNILIITILAYLIYQLIKYFSHEDEHNNLCNIFAHFLFDNKSSYLLLILFILSIIWLVICATQLEKEPKTSNCRRPEFINAYDPNYFLLATLTAMGFFETLVTLYYARKETDCLYFLKCLLFYFSLGICYSKEFPPLNFDSQTEASGINRGDQYVSPTYPNENQQQFNTNKTKNQQNLPDNQAMDNPPQILIPQNGQS